MKTMDPINKPVPLLRGKVHLPLFGFFLILLFTLFRQKSNLWYKLAFYVYLFCTLFMLTAVSILHNNYWNQSSRSFLRRIDYAAIFLMIGGSGFPVAVHYLYNGAMVWMVLIHWSVILFGTFGSLLFNFTYTPKWFRSLIYSVSSLPYFFYPFVTIGYKLYQETALMLSTAFFYITGSVFYAAGWPNLIPGIFESHELFHLFCCFGFISTLSLNYKFWVINET